MRILINEKQYKDILKSEWMRRRKDDIDEIFEEIMNYASVQFSPKRYNIEKWSGYAFQLFISELSQRFQLHPHEKILELKKALKKNYYPKIENFWNKFNQNENNGKK